MRNEDILAQGIKTYLHESNTVVKGNQFSFHATITLIDGKPFFTEEVLDLACQTQITRLGQ